MPLQKKVLKIQFLLFNKGKWSLSCRCYESLSHQLVAAQCRTECDTPTPKGAERFWEKKQWIEAATVGPNEFRITVDQITEVKANCVEIYNFFETYFSYFDLRWNFF